MNKLPANATLSDYQNYVRQTTQERGFEHETIPEVFMLLTEELGEFAKAARKLSGVKVAKGSKKHDLAEEAADVFYLLVDLCNRLGVDLERAFGDKEKKNVKRQWS